MSQYRTINTGQFCGLEYSRFKIELGLHERRFAKSGPPGKNSLALCMRGIIRFFSAFDL